MFFRPVFMLWLLDVLHEKLRGRCGCSVPCPAVLSPGLGVACPGDTADTTYAGWGKCGSLPRIRSGSSKQWFLGINTYYHFFSSVVRKLLFFFLFFFSSKNRRIEQVLLTFLVWAIFIPKPQCSQPQKAYTLGCFHFLSVKGMFSLEERGKKSPESEFCFVHVQVSTVGQGKEAVTSPLPSIPNMRCPCIPWHPCEERIPMNTGGS